MLGPLGLALAPPGIPGMDPARAGDHWDGSCPCWASLGRILPVLGIPGRILPPPGLPGPDPGRPSPRGRRSRRPSLRSGGAVMPQQRGTEPDPAAPRGHGGDPGRGARVRGRSGPPAAWPAPRGSIWGQKTPGRRGTAAAPGFLFPGAARTVPAARRVARRVCRRCPPVAAQLRGRGPDATGMGAGAGRRGRGRPGRPGGPV